MLLEIKTGIYEVQNNQGERELGNVEGLERTLYYILLHFVEANETVKALRLHKGLSFLFTLE